MKVAIATHFPEDPNAPRGGVEAVSVNLVRALAKFGDLDLHVVSANTRNSSATRQSWEGATVHRLPALQGSTLKVAIGSGRNQMHAYLHSLAPDVIHAHDTYGLMVKGLMIPRVFTIHGFIHGDTLVSGERMAWLRSHIWRMFEMGGWADQPHIIAISPYVRERLSGIATGIIHDIDNPIDDRCFDIPRKERRGTIFSAAVISPRKNTLALVEAFSRLRKEGVEANLRLAGDVYEPCYGRLVEERIHEWGLADRVTLLGRINSDQVKMELAAASVFALVSLEENSPMGIEEAMAAGVPVVTSNRCGMPYMVRHGESGFLVDPMDPDDVARRLRHILRDDELRGAMGKRSRDIALDRFHPEVVARRTREVYYETARNGKRTCN